MKNKNLALLLLLALSVGTAQAQLDNQGGTIDVEAQNRIEAGGSPIERAQMTKELMDERKATNEAAREEIQAAREALGDMREEQKQEAEARREETKEVKMELKADVKAGDVAKEEAKVQMEAQREENKAAATQARAERTEAKSAIVSKRQAMIDTRVASVREKNPEMADIMENYYGQIMAKIEAVQTKQTAMLASVTSGEMTGAEARVEFKAYVEVEKADIKALIAEMKVAVKAQREMKSTEG